MQGKIFLVATPIGNLEDITLRAINVLKMVDFIAAEDTRHSLKLLNHLEISKPMISYHRHNELIRIDGIIQKVKNGENVAIISDAGTPAISDPGSEIVKVAIDANIEIVPIPGACALINALIVSGIDTTSFTFLGFLPLNKKFRKIKLEKIMKSENTIIIYEAPHKIINTLKELQNIIIDRKIVLARELTKIHESFFRGSIDELIALVGEQPKGEFVIIIEGSHTDEKTSELESLNEMNLDDYYEYYKKQGYMKKEIIKMIAKNRNVSKNEIYQEFINKE